MTNRESLIYEALKENINIKPEELAQKLGISVRAVELHIEILKQKGYILEGGNIVKGKLGLTIIGGSNIDICGKSTNTPIMADSNIGKIKMSSGGVGRNVAENLANLGADINFVTAIARDVYGRKIFEQLQDLNINLYDSIIAKDAATSTYMYMVDESGEMILAINDMSIIKKIDRNLIESIKDKLNSSLYTFFDANLFPDAIEAIFECVTESKIVIDPVSVNKIGKIAPYLDKVYCLKLNNYEAGEITGVKVFDKSTAGEAAKILIDKGLESIYITIGSNGVLYYDKNTSIYRDAYDTDVANVVNTTGAGDAFSAALLYGLIHNYNPEEILDLGMVVSLLTIESEETCCPDLSMEKVRERLARIEKNE